MEEIKLKPLSPFIFFFLSASILIRPFFPELAYPLFEAYYETCVICLGILTLLIEKKIGKKEYILPMLLILAVYIITTITSVNIRNSFKETFRFISYISIFIIASQTDSAQKKILLKAAVISASIICLYSIYQYLWGYDYTVDYIQKTNSNFFSVFPLSKDILISKRAIGTFPSPNILGSYLIMIFFMSLIVIKNEAFSLKWFIPPVLIIISLILTKSIGAWISFFISGVFLCFQLYNTLKKYRLIILTFFICMIFISILIMLTRWDERMIDLKYPYNSITQRFNYWRACIAIIKDYPVFGIGPGNVQELFLKYKIGAGTGTRYAHNIFLQTWVEMGVLGTAAIFYLINNFFKNYAKNPENKFIFCGMFAFLLHNLIDNTFFIPQAAFFWWFLLALL